MLFAYRGFMESAIFHKTPLDMEMGLSLASKLHALENIQ